MASRGTGANQPSFSPCSTAKLNLFWLDEDISESRTETPFAFVATSAFSEHWRLTLCRSPVRQSHDTCVCSCKVVVRSANKTDAGVQHFFQSPHEPEQKPCCQQVRSHGDCEVQPVLFAEQTTTIVRGLDGLDCSKACSGCTYPGLRQSAALPPHSYDERLQ